MHRSVLLGLFLTFVEEEGIGSMIIDRKHIFERIIVARNYTMEFISNLIDSDF